MVHCNNCTSDLNAWVNLFKEYQELLGIPVNMDEIYSKLYNIALTGDTDCGGLLSYNYISGEPVTGFADGRPLFVRSANDKFNLANFMRTHLYASVGVLKIGNDILFNEEKIKVDRITGHGGLFRTKGVGQRILAAAINSPISVMETAGEGGAWGIALLGSYLVNNEKKQSLADFLDESVFVGDAGIEVSPTPEDVAGFNTYIESYKAGFAYRRSSRQIQNKRLHGDLSPPFPEFSININILIPSPFWRGSGGSYYHENHLVHTCPYYIHLHRKSPDEPSGLLLFPSRCEVIKQSFSASSTD